MAKQLKIALMGKMRSGKDTVGEILIKEYGFRRYAFGDGIREIVDTYFPYASIHGKPRKHYQFIGQSLRQLDEDVWVNYCLDRAGDNKYDNIVVTDVRQPNEVKAVLEEGFILVKIDCDDEIRIERMKASGDNFNLEDLNHETEQHIDKVEAPITITNNGSLEKLHEKVHHLVHYVKLQEIAKERKAILEGENQ